MTRKITGWMICATFLILIGWDIVAGISGGENTITYFVRDMSHKWSIIPFAFGLLVGQWLAKIGVK